MHRRADAVRAADVLAARAFVKLRGTRTRKGMAMWLADERLGTFVVAPQGRSPTKGDLWQMRMLHEHDEKVVGASARLPPVSAAESVHNRAVLSCEPGSCSGCRWFHAAV